MNPTNSEQHPEGCYEIRLRGQLDPRWSAWFAGMALRTEPGGTVIHGRLPDQAALHGLLQRIRDLGLPLTSVRRVEPDPPDTTAGPGTSQQGTLT